MASGSSPIAVDSGCRSRESEILAAIDSKHSILAIFVSAGCDDRAQYAVPGGLCRLGQRQPLHFALAFLQPARSLALHFQNEYLHFADDDFPPFEPLLIGERSDRSSVDFSDHTGFFASLASSRFMRWFALEWPSLRNDPSSSIARSDEQHLRQKIGLPPIWQSCVLNTLRRSFFLGTGQSLILVIVSPEQGPHRYGHHPTSICADSAASTRPAAQRVVLAFLAGLAQQITQLVEYCPNECRGGHRDNPGHHHLACHIPPLRPCGQRPRRQ
jgi:hypothetical protein